MSLSANILKKMLDFPQKTGIFQPASQPASQPVSQSELRPNSVRFGISLLLFYAGRSPPLRHKESGRRFCFLAKVSDCKFDTPRRLLFKKGGKISFQRSSEGFKLLTFFKGGR